MQGIETGSDGAIGDIGDKASRIALGKDIQQMIVALGEGGGRDSDALNKVLRIVLGDGLQWDGVMQELRRLNGQILSLTTEVQTLKQEVKIMKSELEERRETSAQMLLMLRVVLGLVALIAVVYIWQIVAT